MQLWPSSPSFVAASVDDEVDENQKSNNKQKDCDRLAIPY
jgi:hypothetical protein